MSESGRLTVLLIDAGTLSVENYVVVGQQQGLDEQFQVESTTVSHKDSNIPDTIVGAASYVYNFNGLHIRSELGWSTVRRIARQKQIGRFKVVTSGQTVLQFEGRITSGNRSWPHDAPATYSFSVNATTEPIET